MKVAEQENDPSDAGSEVKGTQRSRGMPAEKKMRRIITCGSMKRVVVCIEGPRDGGSPIGVIGIAGGAQATKQGAVRLLSSSIPSRVVRHR
jgi:hypothetical protein